MEIERGNAGELGIESGWFVGYGNVGFDSFLRRMEPKQRSSDLCVKWMHHLDGDPNGLNKPVSEGRTLSVLVSESGCFRVEFSEDGSFQTGVRTEVLREHGDFVIWGSGVYHRWFVDLPSTVLTVRWNPL